MTHTSHLLDASDRIIKGLDNILYYSDGFVGETERTALRNLVEEELDAYADIRIRQAAQDKLEEEVVALRAEVARYKASEYQWRL